MGSLWAEGDVDAAHQGIRRAEQSAGPLSRSVQPSTRPPHGADEFYRQDVLAAEQPYAIPGRLTPPEERKSE